jgi:predicted ATP-grasp superfamily ATP-dependent carboligase
MKLLSSGGRYIVQEWIPGDDSLIFFCLFYCGRDGSPVSTFTGRKIVSNPPVVGSTGICVAAPEAGSELEQLTRRFINHVGFAGMGSLEFKWHPTRRVFMIVEPTVGRSDWQEEIATLCGTNIPLAAYRHELGLPQAHDQSRDAVWRESLRQKWPAAIPRGSGRMYDGYWRPSDPLPGVVYYGDLMIRRLRPRGLRASTKETTTAN